MIGVVTLTVSIGVGEFTDQKQSLGAAIVVGLNEEAWRTILDVDLQLNALPHIARLRVWIVITEKALVFLVLLDHVECTPSPRHGHLVGDEQANIGILNRKVMGDQSRARISVDTLIGQIQHQCRLVAVQWLDTVVVPLELGQIVLVAEVAGVALEVTLNGFVQSGGLIQWRLVGLMDVHQEGDGHHDQTGQRGTSFH